MVTETLQQAVAAPALSTGNGRTGTRPAVGLALLLIVAAYVSVCVLSMRQTSATFDEILLSSAGARGYATGDFDLVELYHPRLMQYLYGMPVALSGARYPEENGQFTGRAGFSYARQLYFGSGNDAQALVFRTRLVAIIVGVLLILLVFSFMRRYYGNGAALLAAAMAAWLPDIIAHGTIAYNDVGIALAFLGSVWALDRAAAAPSVRTACLAGAVAGLTLSVKYSAVAIAPVALLLIGLEALGRGTDWRAYLRIVTPLVLFAILVTYLTLVVVYLGDFTLSSYRAGLEFNILHARSGHGGVPTVLLGNRSATGYWYYFPAAFLIKTPTAFHILLGLAGVGFLTARDRFRRVLHSPLRGPVVGLLVFTAFLLTSKLNIGFRHALPALPLLSVIAAAGLIRLWQRRSALRPVVAGLLLVQAATVLSWYPHFIPYSSEYFTHRDLAFTRLSDSNVDWGQALPLLRRFMDDEGVSTVYLSYFGSALPEAYGIGYVPLRSFMNLPAQPPRAEEPQFVAISTTNLFGGYVEDEFRRFLTVEPYRVLGHSMFIYRIGD